MTDLDDLIAEWGLRVDGEPIRTQRAVVLPVRSGAVAAVLKVSAPGAGNQHAHLVLRRWGGNGAARLLRADPRRGAMLVERLTGGGLDTLGDIDACEVVALLYRRLRVPAMPQLPALPTLLGQWADRLANLPRSAPIPHRLVEHAVTLCRDLSTEPADHVLHGNLQYSNVLAADREPWLAISPSPLNGDPAYELAPMLYSRWDELAGDVRAGVQRRFYTLIDAAGLDEDRARAWLIVRVVCEAAWELDRGADPSALTRHVAVAKAADD